MNQGHKESPSAAGSETTAPPLVPGGSPCDSPADLDQADSDQPELHSSGELEEAANRDVLSKASEAASNVQQGENRAMSAAAGSIRASGSDVEPLAVEDGTVEESLNPEGTQESRTSSVDGVEVGATKLDHDSSAPASEAVESSSPAVPLLSYEKKESQSTLDGEESEVEAVMSPQEDWAFGHPRRHF